MSTLVDDNGTSCFVDDNGVTHWVDDFGDELVCAGEGRTKQTAYINFVRTPVSTSYANPGGTGDRQSSIIVTSNLTAGQGTPAALVDGPVSNPYWWNPHGQTGGLVTFDFGTPRLIDEFRWWQDTAIDHGTWVWEGSSDNSTYTPIGSSFLLGTGVGAQVVVVPNVVFYRYYRLRQISGVTRTEPYLQEAEFKISA